MDLSILNVVFWVCAIVGFAIPLLNLLFGWLGAAFDFGLESDLDIDGPFPFNVLCLCLMMIVFGVLGIALEPRMTSVPIAAVLTALSLGAGVAAYALLYRFVIKKLKASNPSARSYADMLGEQAEVTLRISGEGFGTISVRDSTGAALSFRAKIDPELRQYIGETIPQGTRVVVTEVRVEDKFCYVSTPEESVIKRR